MFKKYLARLHIPHWLTVLIALHFLLRIPTFFEPFSYLDEMIYLGMGEGVRQGLVLYKDVFDHKTPLIYFVAAVAGNLFWFKVILAFWMSATIALFWYLVKIFFPKTRRVAQIATIAFAVLTTIPLFEGTTVNAELLMLGPTLAGILLFWQAKHTKRNLFLVGVCFSVAMLFKVPASFDILAVYAFLFFTQIRKKAGGKTIIKEGVLIALGFFVPILLTFVWYGLRGAFQEYLLHGYLQNFGYITAFRPGDVQKSFLVRNTPLIMRGIITLIGIVIAGLTRKYVSKAFFYTTLWLFVSLFAITLSERPYPHYFIQAVPAISIFIGLLVASPKYEQVISIIPLLIAGFIPVYFKFYFYSTPVYYERFAQFALGRISKEEYFDRFDGNANRNYAVAKYLIQTTKEEEKVYVWGDSPTIYALSRRLPPIKYLTTFHIDMVSTKSAELEKIAANPPRTIVLLGGAPEFVELIQFIQQNYSLTTSIEDAQIWHLTQSQTR